MYSLLAVDRPFIAVHEPGEAAYTEPASVSATVERIPGEARHRQHRQILHLRDVMFLISAPVSDWRSVHSAVTVTDSEAAPSFQLHVETESLRRSDGDILPAERLEALLRYR